MKFFSELFKDLGNEIYAWMLRIPLMSELAGAIISSGIIVYIIGLGMDWSDSVPPAPDCPSSIILWIGKGIIVLGVIVFVAGFNESVRRFIEED